MNRVLNKWSIGTVLTSLLIGILSITGTQSAQAVTLTMADTDTLSFNYSSASKLVGTGKAAGDRILYKNVGSVGGVGFDALVSTVVIGSGSISDYDNPGSATTNASNFQLNTVGGEVTLRFQFFLAGTYTGTGTGLAVVLQNVRITSIDLDSSSAAGSYQYSDFAGFQKYTMNSVTNLAMLPLTDTNANFPTPRVRFQAGKTGSRNTVPEDQVLIKYDSMQQFYVNFGNKVVGSTNYFGLTFGGWPNGGTPVEYSNGFNSPPTGDNNAITLDSRSAANDTLTVTAFDKNYLDADYNPFNAIQISTLPATGTLQYYNGTSWTSASVGQVITTADIESGKFRFNPTGASGSSVSFKFFVNDGLDNSINDYTLTINLVAESNIISFPKPSDTGTALTFPSGASSSSGSPLVYTSNTPGVCLIDASTGAISTISTGICSITVSSPAAGGFPTAYPITQNFNVIAAGSSQQTITFSKPADKASSITFASGATASSGLVVTLTSLTPTICTFSGLNITTLTTSGTCSITASQSGGSSGGTTYGAAPSVTQSFAVTAASSGGGGGGGSTPVPYTLGAETHTANSVFLTGAIDPNGIASTQYQFCYKKTSSLSSYLNVSISGSTCQTAVNMTDVATAFQVFGSSLAGLSSDSTYYYQINALYPTSQTAYGYPVPFKTLKSSSNKTPSLTTNAATGTGTARTLNGRVVLGDTNYSIYYCWSESPAVKTSGSRGSLASCLGTPRTNKDVKNNTYSPTYAPSGLKEGKSYYYQIYATNSSNTYYGNIVRFVIPSVPVTPTPTTVAASSISAAGATLNGSLLAPVESTTAGMCWGTASNLSGCVDVIANQSPFNAAGAKAFSYRTGTLVAGTRYYFRAFALTQGASNNRVDASNILSFVYGSPSVQTLSPTGVQKATGSNWSATLNGFINPNGITGVPSFCYNSSGSTVDSLGKLNSCTVATVNTPSETMTTQSAFSISFETLTASTTYYYQAVAKNFADATLAAYGPVQSFQTIGAPTAVTGSVTNITKTSATLSGTLTANGASTTGTFCLTTNSSSLNVPGVLDSCQFTLTTLSNSPVSNVDTVTALTGSQSNPAVVLTAGTTYYYQLIGDSSQGTAYGAIRKFSTSADVPIVNTDPASNIAATSATLNGTINPKAADTGAKFCYKATSFALDGSGAITSCILTTLVETVSATADLKDVTFNLTGLTAGTTYYYQIVGSNSAGTSYGDVVSFMVGAPYAITDSATVASSTSARIFGRVSASGDAVTSVNFCYSIQPDVDSVTGGMLAGCTSVAGSVGSVATSVASQDEYADLTGLLTGTIYYYQISATNSRGTSYGSVEKFSAGLPKAHTNAASAITLTSATLNGLINANGNDDAMGSFILSDDETLEGDVLKFSILADASIPERITGTSDVAVVQYLENLKSGTTYFFQTFVSSLAGNDVGEVRFFHTPAIVKFEPGDGSGAMTDQTSDTSTAFSVNTFAPPSAGYHFAGWNTAADGSGDTYADGEIYDFINNIVLYAQWSNSCCTVSFNSSGGSGSMRSQTVLTPASTAIRTNTYTRAGGYTFLGWATSSGSSTVAYTDGAVYGFATDLILYAVWSTPSGGSGGSSSGGSSSGGSSSGSSEKKPVVKPIVLPNKGGIKTVAEAKKVIANQIVPVKQEITLSIPPDVKIVEVLINGKSSLASVDANGKISLPKGTLVGPKDVVSVVAESEGEKQVVALQVKNEPVSIGNVNFNFASAKLTVEAKAILKKVATVVKSHGFTYIDLSGHADVFTSAGFDNQQLSEQRNAAVKIYLKKLLPAGITIKMEASAAKKPIIAKTDETSRAINRRVEIIVK